MEAFVLSIQLYRAAPILTFRVQSCEVGERWFQTAWNWAERSGVKLSEGPMFMCAEIDQPYVTRTSR